MQTTIAIDLSKNVFELAVSERPGRVGERLRVSRSGLMRWLARREPAKVLLEACGSSHHWARRCEQLGHEVVLLPPHLVRPYRPGHQKTDQADAKALLEAYRNEEIRPVPVKTVDQQVLAALHRVRSQWVGHRTARINSVRGILRELGFVIPAGAHRVVPRTRVLIEHSDSGLPAPLRAVLAECCVEIRELEERIASAERQIEALAGQTPVVQRLRSIPGIGPLGSTALVAFVGDIHRFPSGRHFASYLGLVPREHSSGHRHRLGRITKRGDTYLRTLLIHGARAVLARTGRVPPRDRLRTWARDLERIHGHNRATVALANKLARIAWAVWKHDRLFEEDILPAAA